MPELLMSHHLVIGKAGGRTVQEAIAARCPMIVNQVIPGQEEGNAELIWRFGLGAIAEKNREVAELVENAFAKKASQWSDWRANLRKMSRPTPRCALPNSSWPNPSMTMPDAGPSNFSTARRNASCVRLRP